MFSCGIKHHHCANYISIHNKLLSIIRSKKKTIMMREVLDAGLYNNFGTEIQTNPGKAGTF